MTRDFGVVDNWKVKGFGAFKPYSDFVSVLGTATSTVAGLRYTSSSIFRTGYFKTSVKGEYHSLSILERQSNGKFVNGVQGFRISARYAQNAVKNISKISTTLGYLSTSWSVYNMIEDPSFTNGFSLTRNLIGTAFWEYGVLDTYISLSYDDSKKKVEQSVGNMSKGLPPGYGIPDPLYGVPDYSSYLFLDSYKELYKNKLNR